jgi:hypothetical protein
VVPFTFSYFRTGEASGLICRRRMISSVAAVVLAASGCARRQASAPSPVPPPVATGAPATSNDQKRRTPAQPRTTPPAPKAQAPSPGRTGEAAAPVLAEMIPPEARRAMLRQIEAALERAQANIATLRGRTSTDGEARAIARVEMFVQQAREARSANDLTAARSIAERADLLSKDLLRSH